MLADRVPLPFSLNLTPRIFKCFAYVHLHKNHVLQEKDNTSYWSCCFIILLDWCSYIYHFHGYRIPSEGLYFCIPLAVLADHVSLPSFLNLNPRIFRYVAYVHLHTNQCSKLDPFAVKCVFLGFAPQQKGYRCYHSSSHRLYVTMDITFSELEIFFSPDESNRVLQIEITYEGPIWYTTIGLE